MKPTCIFKFVRRKFQVRNDFNQVIHEGYRDPVLQQWWENYVPLPKEIDPTPQGEWRDVPVEDE